MRDVTYSVNLTFTGPETNNNMALHNLAQKWPDIEKQLNQVGAEIEVTKISVARPSKTTETGDAAAESQAEE